MSGDASADLERTPDTVMRVMASLIRIVARDSSGREVASGQGVVLSENGFAVADLPPAPEAVRIEAVAAEGNVLGSAQLKVCDRAFGLVLVRIDATDILISPIKLCSNVIIRPGSSLRVVDTKDARPGSLTSGKVTGICDVPWGKVCLISPTPPPSSAGTPVLDSIGRAVGVVARLAHEGFRSIVVVSSLRIERMLAMAEAAAEAARRSPADAPLPGTGALLLYPPPSSSAGRATALIVRGLVAENEGTNGPALSFYRKAVESDQQCAQAHLNLGRVLARGGDTAAAVEAYSEAIALLPDTTAVSSGSSNPTWTVHTRVSLRRSDATPVIPGPTSAAGRCG